MKTALRLSVWLALLFFSIMFLSSYTHYTSIGIDVDTRQKENITHNYYRIRWPANGSVWLGGGKTQRASEPNKPYEPFDLAATLFYPNPEENPVMKSALNRWGFWYKSSAIPNKQLWVGIPSWLPVLMLTFILIFIRRKRK